MIASSTRVNVARLRRAALALALAAGVIGLAAPSAAAAPTIPAVVVFDGQSNSLSPSPPVSYAAKFMRQYLPGVLHVNVAVPGTTYAWRTQTAATRVDVYPPHAQLALLFTEGGQHDLLEDISGAELAARLETYVKGRRAAGYDAVVAATIPPSTYFTPAQDQARRDFNRLLVAEPRAHGVDLVVDIAGIPQLQNAHDRSIYFDGVHYTSYASSLVAQKFGATIFGR